jgi:hypothetical protein
MAQVLHKIDVPASGDNPAAVWTLERHNEERRDFAFIFCESLGAKSKVGECVDLLGRPHINFYRRYGIDPVTAECAGRLVREYFYKQSAAAKA